MSKVVASMNQEKKVQVELMDSYLMEKEEFELTRHNNYSYYDITVKIVFANFLVLVN